MSLFSIKPVAAPTFLSLSFPHWKKMWTTPALFPGENSPKMCQEGIWKAYDFKLSTLLRASFTLSYAYTE